MIRYSFRGYPESIAVKTTPREVAEASDIIISGIEIIQFTFITKKQDEVRILGSDCMTKCFVPKMLIKTT